MTSGSQINSAGRGTTPSWNGQLARLVRETYAVIVTTARRFDDSDPNAVSSSGTVAPTPFEIATGSGAGVSPALVEISSWTACNRAIDLCNPANAARSSR